MVDILHRVGLRAPRSAVFPALGSIDGLSGCWTRDTCGDAEPGGRIRFGFRDPAGREIGAFVMEVLTQTPDQLVRWRVTEGPADWLDTEIEFQLSDEDGLTLLHFTHQGWREPGPFMAHCSTKWATFLLSLKDWVETGHGRPAPDDLKIDNWN